MWKAVDRVFKLLVTDSTFGCNILAYKCPMDLTELWYVIDEIGVREQLLWGGVQITVSLMAAHGPAHEFLAHSYGKSPEPFTLFSLALTEKSPHSRFLWVNSCFHSHFTHDFSLAGLTLTLVSPQLACRFPEPPSLVSCWHGCARDPFRSCAAQSVGP